MAAKRKTGASKVTKATKAAASSPGAKSEAIGWATLTPEVLAHVEAAGARLLANFRLSTVLALSVGTLGAACAPPRSASDEELEAWARAVARQALALEAGLTAELEAGGRAIEIDDDGPMVDSTIPPSQVPDDDA